VHYTDAEGMAAIQEAGSLRQGTFVTVPSEVSGLSAPEIETTLEIQSGRGAFSTTFQAPRANLTTPFNGPTTSGGALQYQLINPATPKPFVPTP
jgi:hypothetical protein